jgi:hypothetical protein
LQELLIAKQKVQSQWDEEDARVHEITAILRKEREAIE